MKHLLTLLLFVGFSQFGFSQSACDNFETAKQIHASADQKDHGTLKQIVLYWSKRCACESGSITGGTWDYTVEVANRVYDSYKDGSVTNGYTGPSFPIPDKRITVNDCNSDNNFNINPDISDCKPNTFSNSKDPQQYGNAFMLARCECEKGVPNEERAKQLEATMKINFQNAQTYYENTLGMPQPLKWTKCPIIQFGGTRSEKSAYSDPNAEIKSTTVDFFELLGNETQNERIQQISSNLNNTQEWIDVFQKVDPTNAEGFDKIEDIAMFVTGIAGIFNNFKKTEVEIKRYYTVNGAQILMTPTEANSKYNVFIGIPQDQLLLVRDHVRQEIGLTEKFKLRNELIAELWSFAENVNKEIYLGIREQMLVSHINDQATEYKNHLKRFISLFEYENIDSIYSELIELNYNIEKLLIQEQIILKEVYIKQLLELNKSNMNREKLLEFYSKNIHAGTEYEYLVIAGDTSKYIHECNFVEYKGVSYVFENLEELAPIYLFHAKLLPGFSKYDADGLFHDFNEMVVADWFQQNLPLFENDFIVLMRNLNENRSPIGPNKRNIGLYQKDIICASGTYDVLDSRFNDSSLWSSGINNINIYPYFLVKLRKGEGINEKEIESLKNKYYEEGNIFYGVNTSTLKNYEKKARKVINKPDKLVKVQHEVLQGTTIKYCNLAYVMLELDLLQSNLSINHLEFINEFISFLELPYITTNEAKTTVLDHIQHYGLNIVNSGMIKSDVDNNDFIVSHYNRPFMRFYLERYYIEKSNGITTHNLHDAEVIKSNLNNVLIDYIRHYSDMKKAQWVLSDLDLLE